MFREASAKLAYVTIFISNCTFMNYPCIVCLKKLIINIVQCLRHIIIIMLVVTDLIKVKQDTVMPLYLPCPILAIIFKTFEIYFNSNTRIVQYSFSDICILLDVKGKGITG